MFDSNVGSRGESKSPLLSPADLDSVSSSPRELALASLLQITEVRAQTLRTLPEALLQRLDEAGADPARCLLFHYAPTWRGAPLSADGASYAVDGVRVSATWRALRALVKGRFESFDEFMGDELHRLRALTAAPGN
jgi:hypothetical protein